MKPHTFVGDHSFEPCEYDDGMAQCGNPMMNDIHREVGSEDITGQPFPPHHFLPPLPGATGSCAYVWKNRPCTAYEEASVHAFPFRRTPAPAEGETAKVLRGLFEEAVKLADNKDAAYGGAWRKQGYMGNVSRVLSKVDRLREMVWSDNGKDTDAFGETIEDTLLDLMNLAAMALHNRRDGNRWGRQVTR